ncbi:hypothetical protein BaRGS_00013243, partial [Batillaria attramentaria]
VCVEREQACAQYGMVAVEDIPAGDVLFSVPRSVLLSPDTSSIGELLKKGQQELSGESDNGWVPLLVALLYEYNNPESLWRPYLDIVPDFSQLDLPMFWSSKEREELLTGTGVVESVNRDLAMMENDFNTKALPFMQKHSDVFGPQCQSLELYKKMVAFIMAYSFTEPRGPGAKQSGKDQGDAGKDEEEDGDDAGTSPPMMVPLADILNHVANNNASLNFDVDALRMVTTKDIKKGEEVYNTYGELANSHLLHMYGFAERYPLNHYDTVDIPMSVVAEVAEEIGDDPKLTAAKLLFLQEQDLLLEEGAFVVGREGVLTDDEMQGVLKVLAMSASEFEEHAEKEGWSDADSDTSDGNSLTFDKLPKLPEQWRKILSSCAEVCLERLAGDEQKDCVAMETETSKMPARERYSLYVRHGQRQLLRQLIAACR